MMEMYALELSTRHGPGMHQIHSIQRISITIRNTRPPSVAEARQSITMLIDSL